MAPTPSMRIARCLRLLLLAGGAGFVLTWLALVCLRIGYPFDLEWMESGTVGQVRRIAQGERLFVAPTLAFTPFSYNPLYYYLGAGLAKLTGVGYVPLRGLSILSSLASLGLVFALVRRETRSAFAGASSACLLAATYPAAGTWFDLARVDSLFLMLSLSGVYALRTAAATGRFVLAGLLFYLAFLTKQTALVLALPLGLHALAAGRRCGFAFAAALLVPCAASVVVLDALHNGWYSYYAFTLPRSHELQPEMVLGFWVRDIAGPVGVAAAAGVAYLFAEWTAGRREAAHFYGLAALGMVGSAWMGRLHSGGAENHLLPAYAMAAIFFGLALDRGVALARGRAAGPWIEAGVYAAGLFQLCCLTYSPARVVPSQRDLDAGLGLVQSLSGIQGDVLIPSHPELAALAGKPVFAHAMAMKDVIRLGNDAAAARLEAELEQAVRQRRFAAIVLSTDDMLPESFVAAFYPGVAGVFEEPDLFWPVAGYPSRPERIYFSPLSGHAHD